MRADFKFYNVGQGCFYAGAIKHNNSSFVVVYDCGTVTGRDPLTPCIKEFKKEYIHIDLLIISHFDKDHVSGVEELIKGIRVERIIMPYMPLWYRIALIAKTSGDSDSYNNLLINPSIYFTEGDFNIGNISYIDQSPNEEGNIDNIPESDPEFDRILGPNEIGDLNLEEPKEDENFKQKVLNEEPELKHEKVSFLQAGTILRLENSLWEFLFYHKQTKNQTDITSFQKAVDDYMTVEGISRTHDLFSLKHSTEIQKTYIKHINSNVNYSSLCVYHGPQFKAEVHGGVKNIPLDEFKRLLSKFNFYSVDNILKSGTLLTGDQFLKKSSDFDPFYNYYRNRLDKTLVFQVPHHGSFKNWKMMPNELNKHRLKIFVINCGHGRKKHPEKNMFQNLLKYANGHVLLNNEFVRFDYSILPKS